MSFSWEASWVSSGDTTATDPSVSSSGWVWSRQQTDEEDEQESLEFSGDNNWDGELRTASSVSAPEKKWHQPNLCVYLCTRQGIGEA